LLVFDALETTFAAMLIAGIGVRYAAFGSAVLLAWFAAAMLVYTGLKPPLDYSVFSASACALLLALHEQRAPTSPQKAAEQKAAAFD
jgi:hypothetical protein